MKERKNGLFSVMTRIEGMSNQFTKTDWKIVQYMKENMQEFVSCSAQDWRPRSECLTPVLYDLHKKWDFRD